MRSLTLSGLRDIINYKVLKHIDETLKDFNSLRDIINYKVLKP